MLLSPSDQLGLYKILTAFGDQEGTANMVMEIL